MSSLKGTHSTVLAGGDLEPHIEGLKTAVISLIEDIATGDSCKDETLLALTVILDLLKESHKNKAYRNASIEVIPKEFAAKLTHSFTDGKKFVGFLSAKILTLLLASTALRNEAIHIVRTLTDKLSHNQLTPLERQCVLDVLILLYSSKKLWPEDSEQLQEIQGSRRIVLTFLQPSWSNMVGHSLSLTSSWSAVDLCAFASLWKKIVKYADWVIDKSDNPAIVEKMSVFISSVEKIFPRICTKSLDAVALCRLLKVANSCLPYSERMSSRQQFQAHHFHLVDVVHTSIRKGLFGQIPSDHLTFVGPVKRKTSQTDNSYVLHRQVSLLVIKSCAITTLSALEDKKKSDLNAAGRHMLQINSSLLSLWSWLREETSSTRGHWLLEVFSDQDNALLESMLALMDIYVHIKLKKLPTSSPFLLKVIDPHCCFVNFLQNLSFDHSVLLDFLSSPETCFLLYFIKYLHFVVRDWSGFKEACEQLSNVSNVEEEMESCSDLGASSETSVLVSDQQDQVQNVMTKLDAMEKMQTDTREGLLQLLHKVNTERILLSQQASSKSVEKNVVELSLRNKDVEKMVRDTNHLLDGTEGGAIVSTKGDMGRSDWLGSEGRLSHVRRSSQSEESSSELFSKLGISLKLTDYSDSEDEDDSSHSTQNKPMAASTTVEQALMNTCSKYLDKESDMSALGDLINSTKLGDKVVIPKLTDYPDSDEEIELGQTQDKTDEMDISETNLKNGKLQSSDSAPEQELSAGQGSSTESQTQSSHLKELKEPGSETEIMDSQDSSSQENSQDASEHELLPSTDSTLDRVMTTIIRLRIVLERLAEKDLFPYNAKPLISVLEQCESRFEEVIGA